MNEARAALRSATATDHERLDGLFGAFRLDDADHYRRFLTAHAMALPAIEDALDAAGFGALLPDWALRHRAAPLAADLADCGIAPPRLLGPPALDTAAAQWGAAYVLEGSRLGGALLARSVADGLPRRYLAAPQPPGAWRAFLAALDEALAASGQIEAATQSARETFGIFEQAARHVLEATN